MPVFDLKWVFARCVNMCEAANQAPSPNRHPRFPLGSRGEFVGEAQRYVLSV